MLNVLGCITQEHEPWLTGLAVVVCLAGTLTFVRLLHGAMMATGRSRSLWVGTSSIAGGGTIWATHFVTIMGFRSSVPLAFDVGLTFASVTVAVALTYLGAYFAAHAGPGRRWMQLLGGGTIGAGIGAMHFMGMRAIAIPGTLTFYTGSTTASLVIGCALATGAVAMLAAGHRSRARCIAATLLLTLAIAGLHFTSMANTAFVLDGRTVAGWAPRGQWVAIAVAVATVLILAACAGTSLLEQNIRLRIADKAHLRELSQQSIRFQAALDNMTQGLCMFDASGELVVHNLRFAAMFGTPEIGATTASLQAELNLGDIFNAGDAAGGDPDGAVHQLPDKRMIQVSRQVLPDTGWVATFEDVTERRRARDQLSYMALHDALTGLPNRVKFREHMDCILDGITRPDIAVLYLDLDGFKGVNDTLGHPIGDELLRAVAARLLDCTRETDMVARLGGDEFAIIQYGVVQFGDMTTLCDRLVAALQMPFDVQGHAIMIGTSIGVALADETSTGDELLRNADIALYRAKSAGRGTWLLFEPEMDAELQARRRLERDLRLALAEEQFELYYQPLINASTDVLTGFEALLRWNHPERGMVPPNEFIPIAEEIGLIKDMGSWVLERACADAVQWPWHIKIAVNLSPVQFEKGNLVRDVEQALAKSGLAANRLELEVTESILLQDNDATLGMLHRLRRSGVRISMDDFGTGYSALSYLRSFPFDKIKIDQSFVRTVGVEKGSLEIIRAVVGLGQALSMEVLAEGVETADQLRRLRHAGCNEFQGYLFSRPKPAREVADIIAGYVNGLGEANGGAPAVPRLMLVSGQG